VRHTLYVWKLDARRGVAILEMPKSKIGKVEVPVRPFFWTIGTAPSGKECISSLVPGAHGANMDFNEVVQGATLHFPVFEPGALFMIGDGHAAQGDGEIMGAAIETSLDVQFACSDIVNWLSNDYGYDKMHAYQLLGQSVVIRSPTSWTRSTRWPARSTRSISPRDNADFGSASEPDSRE
jgi:amidase